MQRVFPSVAFRLPLFLLIIGASASFAQTQWGNPQLGQIFDAQRKSLRPILGYPGAAYLGTASRSGLENAFPSPDGRWTVLKENGQAALVSTQTPGEPLLQIEIPDDLIWSEDSLGFVLHTRSEAASEFLFFRLESSVWVRGAAVTSRWTLPRLLVYQDKTGELWFSAIAEDSSKGPSGEQLGSLYLLNRDYVGVEEIIGTGDFQAVSLATASAATRYVADAASAKILRLDLESGTWQSSEFYSGGADGRRLIAIRVLPDGSFLSAWNPVVGAERTTVQRPVVMRHSENGSVTIRQELDFQANQFGPIVGTSLLRLQKTLTAGGLILLYDTRENLVFFVPDRQADTAAEGGNQ